VRWYVGYDLHEPLPDHFNLTRTRERFGLSIFRRLFERIVGECVEAGLVRERRLSTIVGSHPGWLPCRLLRIARCGRWHLT
jgi:hypothetical protein